MCLFSESKRYMFQIDAYFLGVRGICFKYNYMFRKCKVYVSNTDLFSENKSLFSENKKYMLQLAESSGPPTGSIKMMVSSYFQKWEPRPWTFSQQAYFYFLRPGHFFLTWDFLRIFRGVQHINRLTASPPGARKFDLYARELKLGSEAVGSDTAWTPKRPW